MNLTPSATLLLSPASGAAGAALAANSPHGQVTLPRVVKVQLIGPACAVPARLRAPVMVTVYWVATANAADGVKVNTFCAVSMVVLPATVALLASVTVRVVEPAISVVLKVAVT